MKPEPSDENSKLWVVVVCIEVLKSSVTPIKFEVVQDDNQEACGSEDDVISQSARIMQHQVVRLLMLCQCLWAP